MPRLDDSAAPAYPGRAYYNQAMLFRIGTILFMMLLFHNMFLRDYRSEEIEVLRKSGLSQDIIDAYVPPTSRERISEREKLISEYEQLKKDVASLKEDMEKVKGILSIHNNVKHKDAIEKDV